MDQDRAHSMAHLLGLLRFLRRWNVRNFDACGHASGVKCLQAVYLRASSTDFRSASQPRVAVFPPLGSCTAAPEIARFSNRSAKGRRAEGCFA